MRECLDRVRERVVSGVRQWCLSVVFVSGVCQWFSVVRWLWMWLGMDGWTAGRGLIDGFGLRLGEVRAQADTFSGLG
jgi:hypothetical protein